MRKELREYVALPHRMEVFFDHDSDAWVVRFPELPGCVAHGSTPARAISEGKEAKALWIETALEEREQIPEPQGEPNYSGKLVLRLPKGLHEAAAQSADREGTSLNTYLVQLVSEGVERSGLKTLFGHLEAKIQKAFRGLNFQGKAADYEVDVHVAFKRIGQQPEALSQDKASETPVTLAEAEHA